MTAISPASSSSQGSGSSGVSTGALVGGIAAGVIGLAAVAFTLVYFLRRCNRNNREEDFDSDIFRRQSVMLGNEQTVPRSPSRGQDDFNPRPPTMIERRLANATPVSPVQFTPSFAPGNHNAQYNEPAYNESGTVPGQFFAAQGPYQSQYGGAPGPDSNHNGNFAFQPAYLSRQPSGTDSPRYFENHPNEAQYVDMHRTSVTPFQASQYEEISRRLDIPAPSLGSVVEDGLYTRGNVPPANSHLSPPQSGSPENPMSPVYELNPVQKLPSALVPGQSGRTAPASALVPEGRRPDTVYTVYGDEDAYGGI